MAARIRSTILAADVDELSRNDAVLGSIVTLVSIDAATTYAWAITFAPKGSTAAFTGSATAITPGTFTVDVAGPYLIRLTTDVGLPSEDVQYVRIRALTAFGGLTLVSAGERRDGTGIIPVDVDTEGWANEQNANITTLLAFIKPLVSSGRVLYVDANDGTSEYADFDTVQAAIDDAVTNTPSTTSQWVVLVRPGTYVEDLAFADYVHVIGWPGNSDGISSKSVILEGFHTATISSGATTLLGNLHIEQNTNSTTPVLLKTGAGTLRLFGTRVESNGSDAAQGAAIQVSAGFLDAIHGYFLQNTANAPSTAAFSQPAASTVFLDTCTLVGPSGAVVNGLPTPVPGVFCTLSNCRVSGVHATGSGISTTAEMLAVDHCVFSVASNSSIAVNKDGVAFAGGVDLTVRFSDLGGKDIQYETLGLTGSTTLSLGSVIYRALVYPTTTPTVSALTQSATHLYDNTVSGLIAANVQDALDELASATAINPVVYHKNIPGVGGGTVRYRGWAPISSKLIGVRVYMQSVNAVGTYTLAVTNEATGNTVLSAATFDMNTLVAATVTPMTLTGVSADLTFSTLDRWTVELVSNDAGFNGDSIYVELVFNPATASGPIVEDLATTLLVGNTTGGSNISLTPGDRILGVPGDVQYEVPVVANTSVDTLFFAPFDITVTEILAYCASGAVSTLGTYTLAVSDLDLTNNLLSAATFDMETSGSLPAATLTTVPLTAVAADLNLTKGTRVQATLTSDNADLVASGVYLQIRYQSQ